MSGAAICKSFHARRPPSMRLGKCGHESPLSRITDRRPVSSCPDLDDPCEGVRGARGNGSRCSLSCKDPIGLRGLRWTTCGRVTQPRSLLNQSHRQPLASVALLIKSTAITTPVYEMADCAEAYPQEPDPAG